MNIKGTCEKVESVEKGLKLTIYITDEAQMDEAFRLRKKDVSLSLTGGGLVEEGADKEVVRSLAMSALQMALDSMFVPGPKTADDLTVGALQEEQLSLVGSD